MKNLAYDANSEDDTARLGRALAHALPEGGVVGLRGTLGAGKTRLIQAVAEASGVDRREVVSPTFVLAHEYHGALTIHHLDAYRLDNEAEFRKLGIEEYFDSGALVLIEWADRVAGCLPEEHLDIAIDLPSEGTARSFHLAAHGARYEQTLDRIADELGQA